MSKRGNGPLFVEPDCDAARQWFRDKPKGMTDKVMSVAEAVRRFVADEDYLASGGFGGDRIATAVLHEIIRQKRQRLGFAGHTATHDFQLLCAGNDTGRGQLLQQVDVAYVVGLEARGLSPHARRVVESGQIELCEWTNYSLALRFQAASMGVPFLPMRGFAGTDSFSHSAAARMTCPYTDQELTVVPALWPDIAVIHVHEADCFGNCRIFGTSVSDWHIARAAKKLIISCERLVSNDEIRRNPTSTTIPFYCVDAVCHVPRGSYPGNMPYEYYSDEEHLREWLTIERDKDAYLAFIDRLILSATNFDEYLDACGGVDKMDELRKQELSP